MLVDVTSSKLFLPTDGQEYFLLSFLFVALDDLLQAYLLKVR